MDADTLRAAYWDALYAPGKASVWDKMAAILARNRAALATPTSLDLPVGESC